MERAIVDRMERNVLGQGAHLLSAKFDLDDRIEEVTGAKLATQFLLLDVDRDGGFVVAIDNGGDAAFTTQCTGGSLACPFARLGRQGQRFAHVTCLSKLDFRTSRHASRDDR